GDEVAHQAPAGRGRRARGPEGGGRQARGLLEQAGVLHADAARDAGDRPVFRRGVRPRRRGSLQARPDDGAQGPGKAWRAKGPGARPPGRPPFPHAEREGNVALTLRVRSRLAPRKRLRRPAHATSWQLVATGDYPMLRLVLILLVLATPAVAGEDQKLAAFFK